MDRQTATEVYTEVFRLAQPAPDPSRPDRILRTPGYCRGFSDPATIVEKLKSEFPVAQLCGAGVLLRRPSPSGEECYDLHPDLASADRRWLAIRDAEGRVHDLVGRTGCLSGTTIPFFTFGQDEVLLKNLRNEAFNSLYLTFTVEDAAVLRALGMPAITATGLATLQRRQLRHYRQLLDGLDLPSCEKDSSTTDPMTDECVEFNLTLVAWSPAGLSAHEPPELQQTIESLRVAHAEDQSGLTVWVETEDGIAQLVHTIKTDTREPIRKALQQSAEQSVNVFPPPPPRPQASLAELYRKLDAELASASGNCSAIRLQILDRHRQRFVIPVQTQAMSSDDPCESALLLELADLGEQRSVVVLDQYIESRQKRRHELMDAQLADKLLKNRLQLADRILKLIDLLRKCALKAKLPLHRLSKMFSEN